LMYVLNKLSAENSTTVDRFDDCRKTPMSTLREETCLICHSNRKKFLSIIMITSTSMTSLFPSLRDKEKNQTNIIFTPEITFYETHFLISTIFETTSSPTVQDKLSFNLLYISSLRYKTQPPVCIQNLFY